MFKKFVLATTLGLCLFGISFGQDREHRDNPADDRDTQAAESNTNNQEVKVAMAGVIRTVGTIAASRLGNPVTPLNKDEKDNQKPEPKASPRDSGSKGGNSGSSRGHGRKSGPN
jgi:hypothetical protein